MKRWRDPGTARHHGRFRPSVKSVLSAAGEAHQQASIAAIEIKTKRIRILPPIGNQKRYPAIELTVIHASERGTPNGREAIEWELITDLPAGTRADAMEMVGWYAMRGKIERLNKISNWNRSADGLRPAEWLSDYVQKFELACLPIDNTAPRRSREVGEGD